jgi:ComF family protein
LSIERRPARRLLEAALAALFPADCFLCRQPLPWRQKGSVCLPCWERLPWCPGLRPGSGSLRAILWAADYEGPFRRLIHGLKFEEMDYLGRHLGDGVAERLAPLLQAPPATAPLPPQGADTGQLRPEVVIPVPLHWWRRYRRGYNQALLIARAIASRARLPIAEGRLVRRRPGRRQLGLSRRERFRSLTGCFFVRTSGRPPERQGEGIAGRRILLVDDVVTTGATLEAGAQALARAGAASIVGCVVARTRREIKR